MEKSKRPRIKIGLLVRSTNIKRQYCISGRDAIKIEYYYKDGSFAPTVVKRRVADSAMFA
jgi:hypothetical protein